MPYSKHYEPIRFNLVAGVLAVLVPGAGHVYLGQRLRGVIIGVGVLLLFLSGLFIGGLTVVDSTSGRLENRISFYGQAMVGPVAIAVDRIHHARFKAYDFGQRRVRSLNPGEMMLPAGDPRNPNAFAVIMPAEGDEGPPYVRAQGKVHEIGLLYTVLAGMLNFIVIIDALFPGGTLKPGVERPAPPARDTPADDLAGGGEA